MDKKRHAGPLSWEAVERAGSNEFLRKGRAIHRHRESGRVLWMIGMGWGDYGAGSLEVDQFLWQDI